jgi:hypothetical protein
MFGVIIAIVVVVTVMIGAVGRYMFKRRQAEARRREALAKPYEPIVFIPGTLYVKDITDFRTRGGDYWVESSSADV